MMKKTPRLKLYEISNNVTAFSTTRRFGYSQGNYAEFNVNEYCGDDIVSIEKNRQALMEELNEITGISSSVHLIIPHQTHGTEIRRIDNDFLSLDKERQSQILEGVDGLMTGEKGICVCVSTADCIPVMLYDAKHNAVAAVHAGWRGTLQRIVRKAVVEMKTVYNSNPESMSAIIGPGISLENFEVGDEVYQKFDEAGFDMNAISRKYEKWHIDLWECNRLQLMAEGMPEGNISIAGVCTYANAEDFFSARRLGIDSGRILNGIMIC